LVQECVGDGDSDGDGGRVEVVVVNTRYRVSQPGADADACVSMITYRVGVYQSRPIGASLHTTSPQQGCLALKGLLQGLAGRGERYPLNTDLDWGLSSYFTIGIQSNKDSKSKTNFNKSQLAQTNRTMLCITHITL